MINVFYGEADIDAEKFMYGRIKQRLPERTVLIVPNQFTLQAERNALEYLNTDTLMNLEILGRNRFESKLTDKTGIPPGVAVNSIGRYMLLTMLTRETDNRQEIFADAVRKGSFVEMLNDMISELKQYNVNSAALLELADVVEDDVLQRKLAYISGILGDYEKISEGRFTDTEDTIKYAAEHMDGYEDAADCEFWFEGFYYMTPVMTDMVAALAECAESVNILLTDDGSGKGMFQMTKQLRRYLSEAAERAGIMYYEERISDDYRAALSPEVSVVQAGDFYSEAETAAVEISELVREKGYRYSDIAIICNDMEYRRSVFKRVFETYGIPLFMDEKRSITQAPEVEFIFAMFECIRKRRAYDAVFRMLKTGYSPISDEECEKLENYCRKYHINSGGWKKDFKYGVRSGDITEEELEFINISRKKVDDFITAAENLFDNKETVRERTAALYKFMTDIADMRGHISSAYVTLADSGEYDYAGSAAQIWEAFVGVMDQVVEVLGDEVTDYETYEEVLKAGFSGVEIGLIPTANDQVILGTIPRTMTGRMRALFIAGANEGVLPKTNLDDGILSDDEKQMLADRGHRISGTGELSAMEMEMSVYQIINRAEEYLTVSYAVMNESGEEIRPSSLVSGIQEKYGARIQKDAVRAGEPLRLIQSKQGAMSHLVDRLRRHLDGRIDGELEDEWKAMTLVSDQEKEFINAGKGLFFDKRLDTIERETVKQLYGGKGADVLSLSASKLENYSRCPFSFFIRYGLRPHEERAFEADSRSIGDICHDCMRRVSESLTEKGVDITSPDSMWMKIDRKSCETMISDFVDEFTEKYREGIFRIEGRESYIASRIRKLCTQSAWTMIQQVRAGKIRALYFEKDFSRRPGAVFPPVRVSLKNGETIYIEGIIDRVDILADRETDVKTGGKADENNDNAVDNNYVRIIDYKSGNEKFDRQEVMSGYRMQLITYLRGAMGGIENARPAGVFYFPVREYSIDVSHIPEELSEADIENALYKKSSLDGIMLNNASVIFNMGGEKRKNSEKSGAMTVSKERLLSEGEFDALLAANDENIRLAAEGITGGVIDIEPKSGKKSTPCVYCGYRTICNERVAEGIDSDEMSYDK